MPENLSVQIRIGQENNHVFAVRLQELVQTGMLPEKTEVSVKTPKPSVGGFALTVPPEVMVAVGTALASAAASEIVKTIWSELRDFLQSRRPAKDQAAKPIVIIINGQTLSYQLGEMPDSPPLQPS